MDLFKPQSPTESDDKPDELSSPFTKPAVPVVDNPFNKSRSIPEAPASTDLVPHDPETADNDDSPKLEALLDNADGKIKLAQAHNLSLETLVNAVAMMQMKLDDIKPDKLPSVIAATSKVVEGIRRERNEANKAKAGRDVHLHFYTPTQRKLEDYEVVEVG